MPRLKIPSFDRGGSAMSMGELLHRGGAEEKEESAPSTRESSSVAEKEHRSSKSNTWTRLATLFTHHDRFNVHKMLGISILVHYLLRFFWLAVYGSMFFDRSSWVTWATPAVHLLLSLSSFIFPVPKHRFGSKPIIWKELQLHNIIFIARSSFVMIFYLAFPIAEGSDKGVLEHYMTRFIIVAALHYAADVVTDYFQDRGRTTTRDIPWDQGTPQWLQSGTKKYYAICQLLATTAVLGQTEVFEGAFAIMFPIHISTFLMTLVRKNIISGSQWHFWYAVSLSCVFLIPFAAVVHSHPVDPTARFSDDAIYYKLLKWSMAPIAVLMRLYLRTDKFVIMGLISAGMIFTTIGMSEDGMPHMANMMPALVALSSNAEPNRTISTFAQTLRQYVGASIALPIGSKA